MLVELIGLPGSGKSTLVRSLLPALRQAGLSATRANKLAGLPSADPEAPRYLKRGEDRTMLFRSLAFRRRYQELCARVDQALAQDAEAEFLFALTGCYYQAWNEHRSAYDFVLLDEGFTHRGVSAHLDLKDVEFERYMQVIPLPDVTLNLCPPPRTALRRAIHRRAGRGQHRRKVEAKLGDQQVFRRRHRLMEIGLDVLKARGARIIDVDTSHAPEDCVAEILPQFKSLMANRPLEQISTQ